MRSAAAWRANHAPPRTPAPPRSQAVGSHVGNLRLLRCSGREVAAAGSLGPSVPRKRGRPVRRLHVACRSPASGRRTHRISSPSADARREVATNPFFSRTRPLAGLSTLVSATSCPMPLRTSSCAISWATAVVAMPRPHHDRLMPQPIPPRGHPMAQTCRLTDRRSGGCVDHDVGPVDHAVLTCSCAKSLVDHERVAGKLGSECNCSQTPVDVQD